MVKSVSINKSVVALAALVTMGFLSAPAASAGLVLSIEGGLSATAGSTGNSFEVDVSNTGATAADINSFAFQVSINNTDVTLTGTTDGTTNFAYIFGDSLFGPNINTLSRGQSMDGQDTTGGNDFSLGAGDTIGLGEIFYDVANGAGTGPFTLSFSPSTANSFSDGGGQSLDTDSSATGSITITAAAVSSTPEPSSLSLMALAVIAVTLTRKTKLSA